MKTAVLSCVYPGVEPFLPDFFSSLSNQTDKDFTLLLINDGIQINEFITEVPFQIEVKPCEGSPAYLRKTGIRWAAELNYEAVVFADADDRLGAARVKVLKSAIKPGSIVFNDLILFGTGIAAPTSMFRGRLTDGDIITQNQLLHSNCLGLSNTAVLTQAAIPGCEAIPDDIIAFDWALFTKILYSGSVAIYTSWTETFYRQHNCNIAGPFSFSDKQIIAGVKIKAQHYALFSDINETYNNLSSEFNKLQSMLVSDETFMSNYCNKIRSRAPQQPFWWEAIRPWEELDL